MDGLCYSPEDPYYTIGPVPEGEAESVTQRLSYHWFVTGTPSLDGCNNGIGGFHENLVTFRDPELPIFLWAPKMHLKNAVLRCNKKSGQIGSVAPKCKMAENFLRIDRHRPIIGLNPNFLGYSNSPWTGPNMHTWFDGENKYWWKVPAFPNPALEEPTTRK